jgi:RNA polymerase sigma factor (sigma-70 family)
MSATPVSLLSMGDATAELSAKSAPTDDPVCQLEQKQLSVTLLSAIDELLARQRDVFVLYQMHGCGGDEIARRVGLSCNNVWVTLNRARHSLRAQLYSAGTQHHLDHRRTPGIHGFSNR